MNENNKPEEVRETLERVMREKGFLNNPVTMKTDIGDFTWYVDNDSPFAKKRELETELFPKVENNRDTKYAQLATPNVASDAGSATSTDYSLYGDETNKVRDFSYLSDTPLNIELTAMPQQAHLRYLDETLVENREINEGAYTNNILENDCYKSERFEPFAKQVRLNEGENQDIIYANPERTGTDQPTKYGISQSALNLYRDKYRDIASSYPSNIYDLTEEQAMNFLCQYYKGSRAEAINNPNMAFAYYDSYVNHPNKAIKAWQQSLRQNVDSNIQIGNGVGSQTINGFNAVSNETPLLESFIDSRMQTVEPQYQRGLMNRFLKYRVR